MQIATVYARQSLDKKGDTLAIGRQLQLCRAFAVERGWQVTAEFTDNDISASSGAERPGFEALLAANPERIVVWHTDRLMRLTRELERVIALGVNVHAVQAGHLDLSNPAGRAVARTVTAWAQYEGEQKALRQRAANLQRAQRGISLWTRRPFGFDRDGHVVRLVEGEAAEIAWAAQEVLAGRSLAGTCADLNDRDVPTASGGRWTVTTLKRVLLNPRNVGRVVYNGDDLGVAAGQPTTLPPDTYERLEAKLTDPRRRNAPSTQVKHLLSGLVRCSRCDEPMLATKAAAAPIYRCLTCKRARRRDLVDELVVGVVLARLALPDAAALLAPGVDVVDLQLEVVELRDRRDGLAAMLADGLLGREAVRAQAERLGEQIAAREREIDAALGESAVAPLVGVPDPSEVWQGLPLLAQRAVIDTLLVAYIEAAGKGVRFAPDQVTITWR